ncbi:unnamed protein product [Prunus armeniaca]|uniref:Disease resistance protein At4g27190-like leucine-rich repeats domain-containing protein n=1 Tax=Prunus armeniaca TaxID=36596 RepID=A0A6J5U7W9_PRUAR|nr:unnamed protein product [Prunus armeniaca]
MLTPWKSRQLFEGSVHVGGHSSSWTANNLKILSLLYSKVKELPKEIGQLTRLQLLDLTHCSELVRIPPGVISSLTSLEDLRIGSLRNGKEVLMPKLTSLIVDGCGGLRFLFSSSMARSLVQLKNLTISRCQIMEEIVPTNESSEEDTDHDMFSPLQDLKLQYLPNLTRFCSARRSINFHSLEVLHVEDCSKLETFIFDPMNTNITINKATEEIRDSTENIGTDAQFFLFDEMVGFPSLESLIICDLPKLRTIWHRQLAPDSFRKLKKVEVLRCQASLAKGLQQLSELYVENCGILEEIVAKDGLEMTPEFVFSKWPLLKSLIFIECGKVEILASEYSRFEERLDSGTPIKQPFLFVDKGNPFPNLEVLHLDKNAEIWYEAHSPLPAKLFINLKEFAFSSPQKN